MTTNQPVSTPNSNSLGTSVIVAICVLTGLVLVGVIVLTIIGKPIDNVLTISAAIVTPTLAALLAAKKMGDALPVLHDVSVKVNGRLDNALSTINALEAQVVASGGTPVTTPTITAPFPVVAPRHSAENPPPSVPVPAQEVATVNG